MSVLFASFCIEVCSSLVVLVLIYATLREKNLKEKATTYFLSCLISAFITIVADLPTWFMVGNPEYILTTKILFTISYIALQTTIALYTFYLVAHLNERTFVSNDVPIFVSLWGVGMSAIYISLMVDDLLYVFTKDGNFVYGELHWLTQLPCLIPIMFNAILVISCRRVLTRKELFTWLAFPMIPACFLPFVALLNESAMYFSMALVALLTFVNIHIEQSIKIIEQESELTDSKMKVMLSQIQPHFMYNSLNSIYYLIEKDPELAQRTLNTFSTYLRSNINALRSTGVEPFEKELAHIKAYLELEKVRFGDELNIVYDIGETDFKVPPLSVQPMVENAVKHGISQKVGGGTLKFMTRKTDDYYEILIKDDGVGFDTKNSTNTDKTAGLGVGLETVRERIKTMCLGTVDIYSIEGKGTDVVIKIPREAKVQ